MDIYRYRFEVDNRAVGPMRNSFEEAASDAVDAGWARPQGRGGGGIRLKRHATIERYPADEQLMGDKK